MLFSYRLFRAVIIIAGCHMIVHMRKACSEEHESPSSRTRSQTTRSPGVSHMGDASATHLSEIRADSANSLKVAASHRTGTSDVIGSDVSPFPSPAPSSIFRREQPAASDTHRLRRVLRLAQRFGLPPPLREDLDSMMWGDAVVTINRLPGRSADGGATMEMGRARDNNWTKRYSDAFDGSNSPMFSDRKLRHGGDSPDTATMSVGRRDFRTDGGESEHPTSADRRDRLW